MSTSPDGNGKGILEQIARRVMQEHGFLTDFSQAALDELKNMHEVDWEAKANKKDLRQLLWASIDNDDSLDLDQLTVAEVLPDNKVKILVAVADVDTLVKKNSAIDEHAHQNTTSIYTAGKTFPMLPERLSTDLTSLNYQEDRPAIVIEMIISDAGEILSSDIYPAEVRNHAKLAYNAVAAWLEGKAAAPDKTLAVDPSLQENLRIQDRVAQKLRSQRHQRGALELQTLEARPVFAGDQIQDLQAGGNEPGQGDHRGLYDCRQRRDSAFSPGETSTLLETRGTCLPSAGTGSSRSLPSIIFSFLRSLIRKPLHVF